MNFINFEHDKSKKKTYDIKGAVSLKSFTIICKILFFVTRKPNMKVNVKITKNEGIKIIMKMMQIQLCY